MLDELSKGNLKTQLPLTQISKIATSGQSFSGSSDKGWCVCVSRGICFDKVFPDGTLACYTIWVEQATHFTIWENRIIYFKQTPQSLAETSMRNVLRGEIWPFRGLNRKFVNH